MLELFRRPASSTQGTTQPGYFEELRQRLQENVERVTVYLRQQTHSVASNHVLVRILSSLPIDLDESLFYNIDRVKKVADRVAKAHEINTAQQSSGIWERGVFYGESTHETWVAIEQNIDYIDASEQWQQLRPIQILRHPNTTLSIPRIDEPDRNRYQGHAIIAIDLVALAIQFYMWHHRQRIDDDAWKTPRHFLLAYPLANALPYHIDWAIMNRLQQFADGYFVGETENDWPFQLQQFDRLMDRYLRERIDDLYRRNSYYETMLQQIGLAFHDNAYTLTRAPQGPRTQQIEWVYWWAEIPPLHMLLQIDYDRGGSRNRRIHREIEERVRAFMDQQAMEMHIGPRFYYDVRESMQQQIQDYLEIGA